MTQAILPTRLWGASDERARREQFTSVPMFDSAGQSFEDQYSLQSTRLGDGMTACVFVVTDRSTGALCACKLAERRPQRHTWSRLCQLMRHESNLLQQIGYHPNIVHWRGCYASCNRVAIVMELVGGGDCQQLLQRHGALAEDAVQAMIRQLHAALSRLHELGVLHRDVKLENLLCDTSSRPPRVKLCDFGHAVHQRDLGHDRHFYGTPGYAAPEVMQGPVWTAKADVWAMGVVMYALLANALPFEYDDGWRRPADLSSRAWWRVSLEAKLLLQSLLEPSVEGRGSLRSFEQSAWRSLPLDQRRDGEHAVLRHAFSSNDVVTSLAQSLDNRKLATGRAAPPGSMPHAASWTELQGANNAACVSEGGAAAAAAAAVAVAAAPGAVPVHALEGMVAGMARGMDGAPGGVGGAAHDAGGAPAVASSGNSSDTVGSLTDDALMAELIMPRAEGSSVDASPSASASSSPTPMRDRSSRETLGAPSPLRGGPAAAGGAAATGSLMADADAATPVPVKSPPTGLWLPSAAFAQLPVVPPVPTQQQAMDMAVDVSEAR